MVDSPVDNVFSRVSKELVKLPFLICVGLFTITLSGLSFRSVNAEPIVILEYRGAEMVKMAMVPCIHLDWIPIIQLITRSCKMKR